MASALLDHLLPNKVAIVPDIKKKELLKETVLLSAGE